MSFSNINSLNNQQWIAAQLQDFLPDVAVCVQDPRRDDQHLVVHVAWHGFSNMPLVQCHQKVYAALDNMRQGRLHALTIHTYTQALPAHLLSPPTS